MIAALGTSVPVFLVITVALGGGAAYSAGQALADNWRPIWQMALSMFLLGLATRFGGYALFHGELLSLSGYLIDTVVLMVIGLLSYRRTQARKLVQQYPWLYQPRGYLGWRELE